MKFKSLLQFVTAIAAVALVTFANAAGWNDSYGMGDRGGEGYFSASGAPLAVVGSVRSNSVYVAIGGPNTFGSPLFQSIWVNTDLATGTLDFWGATNVWTCASNQPAGTNIIWITTNSASGPASILATNDVLVLQNASGASQVLLISGNATDLSGVVYSNSTGVGIKVFQTPTNTITAGDKIYKMARRATFTPLAIPAWTNGIAGAGVGAYIPAGSSADTLKFYGDVGEPSVVSLSYAASGSLYVSGVLKRREQ